MSGISTQLSIIDKMSGPLFNIVSAVDNVVSSLQSVDNAAAQGFDATKIYGARQAIDKANAELDEMAEKIRQAEQQQQKFNNTAREGNSVLDGLGDSITGMVAAYAGIQGLQKLVGLSDSMTQVNARLGMMVDEYNDVDTLQDKIFGAAQRARTDYMSLSNVVAGLGQRAGDAFSSNNETIAFAENLSKMFVIAGASQQEMSAASLQLTQALGSGVLRGDELNSIFESAPNIIQAIADYMDVPIGKIRNMAAEGQITADIVKNAILGATGNINAQFEKMPMTWSQVWTGAMNKLLYASQPILDLISLMAQNWATLEPIILGVVTVFGLYLAALGIHKGLEIASAVATGARTVMQNLMNKQLVVATSEQMAFNAALLASPLTWIIVGLIAIVAAFYAVIAAVNKATGSTLSATGMIAGAIAVAGAAIWNTIVGVVNFVISIGVELYNLIAVFANFFANVFNDPVGAIINLFAGMFDFILGIVQSAAKLIDTVLGTDMSGAVAGFRDTVANKTAELVGEQKVVMEKKNAADFQFKGMDYGDAWKAGNKFGEGIENKVSGMFGGGAEDAYSMDELLNGVNTTAANTGAVADSVAMTGEELKYLNDIAEQEVINRFTTAEIKVDMTNNNNINSGMDIDGIVDQLASGVNEAMEQAAEGVHS